MPSSDSSIVYPFALILGSPLHKGAKCDSSSLEFSTNLKSITHYHQTPTVPLSLKNPQRYQRSEQSAATRRPPSTQLKPIFIYLKGKFAAAHSRKVGTVSGDPPKTCIAPLLNPDRSAILRKSVTLLKVGICCAPRALRVGRLSCR